MVTRKNKVDEMTLGFEMEKGDATPAKKPTVKRTRKKLVETAWIVEALLKIGRGRYLLFSQLQNAQSAPLAVAATSAKVPGTLQVQCGAQTPALFSHTAADDAEAHQESRFVCVLSDVSEEAGAVQLVLALQGGERLSSTQSVLNLKSDNTEAVSQLALRFAEPLNAMMQHEKAGASPIKDFLRVFQKYASSVKSPVEGLFERIDENGLASGWAFNRLNPTQRLQVGVYEGERLVGWAVAHLPRPALKTSQKSDPKVGFEIKLSPVVFDGKPHSLNAFIMGTEQALAGGPIAFKSAEIKPAPDAGILGYDKSVKLIAASGDGSEAPAKQAELQAQMATVCVLMEGGFYTPALKLMENWPDQGQHRGLIEFKKAECEMLLKQYEAANKRFAALVKSAPEAVWGWWGLGEVFFRMEKFKYASKCFSEANRRQPDVPGILKRLAQLRLKVVKQNGVASLSKQQASGLLEDCRKMIVIDGNNAEAVEILFDLTAMANQKKSPPKWFKDHKPEVRELIHARLALETLCTFITSQNMDNKKSGSQA